MSGRLVELALHRASYCYGDNGDSFSVIPPGSPIGDLYLKTTTPSRLSAASTFQVGRLRSTISWPLTVLEYLVGALRMGQRNVNRLPAEHCRAPSLSGWEGSGFPDCRRGTEGTAPVSMVTSRAGNQRGLMQEDGGESKGGRCYGDCRAKGGW